MHGGLGGRLYRERRLALKNTELMSWHRLWAATEGANHPKTLAKRENSGSINLTYRNAVIT